MIVIAKILNLLRAFRDRSRRSELAVIFHVRLQLQSNVLPLSVLKGREIRLKAKYEGRRRGASEEDEQGL